MIKVTIGSQSWTVASMEPDALPEDARNALLLAYSTGTQPKIETVGEASIPFPETPAAPAAPAAPVFSTFSDTTVDTTAAERIGKQHDALRAAGFTKIGKTTSEGGEQFFATGTRMMAEGYATQASRKADHDKLTDVRDAAHALVQRIEDENREDVNLSAAELGRDLALNGTKVLWRGRELTEQAIRGLAARLESPMLGYVLGLRERMATSGATARQFEAGINTNAKDPKVWEEMAASRRRHARADLVTMCEVLKHECAQNGDVRIKVRTRNAALNDVFAVVSQQYAPADAPAVLGRLIDALPSGAKGKQVYDPTSTAWELQAEVWTPTPVEIQAVGEPFRGYASLRGRDNGTGRASGSGGIEVLRCLNASVYTMGDAVVSRVHRGNILADLNGMIDGAINAISVLCNAWGVAREQVIPLTAKEKEMGDQFMTALWSDLLRNDRILAGVLPGRVANHAEVLTKTFHSERRDPSALVRSDLGQAWTKYIQGQPMDVRKDAENAMGRWIVEGKVSRKVSQVSA